MKGNTKILALITAASMLVVTALFIFSLRLGYFGNINSNSMRNRYEVRAAYDPNFSPVAGASVPTFEVPEEAEAPAQE